MKTRRDIEQLKAGWLRDPLWDIEDTEGFEAHHDELVQFRETVQARWRAAVDERERALDAEAERIGVHGLLRLLREAEARQQRQHEAIALLADGRAHDAWRALCGYSET